MSQTTTASVAENATLKDVLPLDGLTLIGIFSAHDGAAALVRTSRGQITRVKTGAEVAGLTIKAIGDETVIMVGPDGTSHVLTVAGR